MLRKLIGVLLIAFSILVLCVFAGSMMSPQLRQTFAGVFCAPGETLKEYSTGSGENRNDAIFCANAQGQERDISATYYIALFGSFLVPLWVGKTIYGKRTNEAMMQGFSS